MSDFVYPTLFDVAVIGAGHAGIEAALAAPDTQLRLFGKPGVSGSRRLGVTLARDTTIDAARAKAVAACQAIEVTL